MTVGEGLVRGDALPGPARDEGGSAYREAARQVALLVGDACVVRRRDADGITLTAVATHHRDAAFRSRLERLISDGALPIAGGWVTQALERNCVLRLPEITPIALAEAGIPSDFPVADVIVVPVAPADAVIVALRDLGQQPFSFADRLALERIAADLFRELRTESIANDPIGAHPGREEPPTTAEPPRVVDRLRLLDLTDAGLWMVDSEGVTSWVNEAASELVGIPAQNLVGQRIPEFIAGANGALGGDLHADHRSDRKLTRPDGSHVWLAATGRPLFDDDGKPAGTLLTLSDIDERKRREVDLRMRLQAKEALFGLAEHSFDAPDLTAILTESVRMVAEQLDAALTSISTIDLHRREATVRAAAAHDDDAWPRELLEARTVPVTEGAPILLASERGKTIVVDDFGGADPTYPMLVAHGIRSGVFVPLGDRESVLTVLSRHPAAIDSSAAPLIESVARMIVSYRMLVGEMRRQGCSASPVGVLAQPSRSTPYSEHDPVARWKRRPRRPV